MPDFSLLKASALGYIENLISSAVNALTINLQSEVSARIRGVSRTGILSLSNITYEVVNGETIITASIDPLIAQDNIAITARALVELPIPATPTTAVTKLRVAQDSVERTIMRERNTTPAPAEQLAGGRGVLLELRGGNWVLLSGASNARLDDGIAAIQSVIGSVQTPIIRGRPNVGEFLDLSLGSANFADYEIAWQSSATGVGTQNWFVITGANSPSLRLSDPQKTRFIRARIRPAGSLGNWTVTNVIGPVGERWAGTLPDDVSAALDGVGAIRVRVPQLHETVARSHDLRDGVGAPPPVDLYRDYSRNLGTQWLGAVSAPLPANACNLLTTYNPPENVIHPCVVEFSNEFCGYRYICAITAYPNGPSLEDPFVYGSNDRVNWILLGGAPQPLDVKSATPGSYNSDTFLTHDPRTGELIVGWRRYEPRDGTSSEVTNSDVILMYRSTRNGYAWSKPRQMLKLPADQQIMLAPTVIFDPETLTWHMWVIDRPVMQHWSAPALTGPWTLDTTAIDLSMFTTPHHHEVKWVGDRAVCLLFDRGLGNLYFGVFTPGSWNNITWDMTGVLNPRPASLYKASFLPLFNNEMTRISFDLWWTNGAAGPTGGTEMGHGRKLQYSRTNIASVSAGIPPDPISIAVADKISNDEPVNTDAGLNVKDRDGKVLLRADEEGTFLAGRTEPLERTLDLLTLPVVRPTAHAGGLDIRRLTDLTADSRAALAQGLAARGGRIAPVPTCVLPQPTDWGTSWLSTQRIPIGPNSPRINADPFYRENVANAQFVHPHVMHFPHGFLGYEYLMCINPYPGGNDQLENPILYGSHNMIDWHLFGHLDQPLADASRYGDGANFLSDNTLFYDPLTGELICMWRRHKWVGQLTTYEWRSTLDGKHWSDIRVCYENVNTEAGSAAPDMVYNPTDGLWYLYFSSESKFMCRTKRDFRDMSEPWSAPVETGVNGWHQEIRVLGDRLWMFSCIGTNNIAFNAHRSRPGDWTKFDLVRNQVLDASAFIAEYGSATTYKNSLVPHLYSDGTAQVKALVQCRRAQSEWWMFYGETARTPIGA